jgi:hypothetical protein
MKWHKLDEEDSSNEKSKFSKSKSIKKMKDHDKIFQSKKKFDKRDKR